MRSDFYPTARAGKLLKIEGYNQNRLLNECMKQGVTLYETERVSACELRVKVAARDLKKTFAILEKLCYTYSVVKSLGAVHALLSRTVRLGLLASLAMLIALYALSYGFIWRIEITGNAKVDTLTIVNSLTEQSIKVGASKKKVDEKSVESALRRLDGIAEASCVKRGTTLKISVMEDLDYVPRPSGNNAEILSQYDAEITRYTVRSGTAKVKVGQRVAKGSVLISGEIIGTEGQVISTVRAGGEVFGKVVFKESVTVAKSGVRTTATGKRKRSTVLRLWGLRIGKPFDGFALSRTTATASKLTLLPVSATSYVTEELTAEPYELSDEEAAAQAEAILRERLREQLTQEPTEEKLFFKELGGGVIQAELYVAVEMKIGEL